MAESLILFTIGPVQRFIETARKTEDLWMGSYILSYLNGIAMDVLTENFRNPQIKIIFPSLDNQPLVKFFKHEELDGAERERLKLPTLPNRLLALDKNGTVTKDHLEKVERNVRDEFERIAEHVFDQAFERTWRGNYAQEMFDRQITRFLEIYWVIHPMNRADYKEEYNLLERKLGGVKSCRRFEQIEEESRKCSLCGEREVIHFSRFETETMGEMNKAIKQDWKDHWTKVKDANTPYQKYLNPNEFLCAVCLTKRLGGTYFAEQLGLELKGTFPSTAEVATSAFKSTLYQGLATKDIQACYTTYMTLIDKLEHGIREEITGIPKTTPLLKIQSLDSNRIFENDRDGSWLLEETLTEKYLIRSYTHKDPQNAQLQANIRPYVEDLRKYRKDHLLKTQSERFEQEQKLLHDKLTERKITESEKTRLQEVQLGFGMKPAKYYAVIAMDGDSIGEKISKVQCYEDHQKISLKLSEYAQKVQEIVEQKYLGKLLYAGGDDVLALANLQDCFSMLQELRKFPSFNDINGLEQTTSSISAGVCIAHYKTPLSVVIQEARKMEKSAKDKHNFPEKNALGIALLTHSGNASKTLMKWTYQGFESLVLAETLSRLLKTCISNKFLYSLREEFSRLVDENGKIPFHRRQLLRIELNRLLQRRKRKEGLTEDMLIQLSEQLTELQSHVRNFDHFIGFLEVCNFIAREG